MWHVRALLVLFRESKLAKSNTYISQAAFNDDDFLAGRRALGTAEEQSYGV